ncbi:glutathione S-transferase [Alkalilimnicola ehrlichii]|uniref:Glutathione S-transferase n=1 Tax=Alkalilimnicola ehrlichii TaxID=351052 RepID=A0A3E0WQV7_9GAMM|nr:glutathione S-transferase family protein [Alkalilimnicola ehrlichii]RFA27176.1 glutathione S-transferase [Alkalilimnicola ehrlichii]RFA35350.1 glutathione S-transferase [Alkalilimnicola ehrlichii]
MEPILFYGVPSGCSFGSIVALEWLDQPYRLCRIDMPEQVTSAAYRRINPVAETPTLMTASGTTVSESMAIMNHVGARGIDKGLGFAQGTPEFDRLNQVLAYLNTSLFSGFAPLWYTLEHDVEQPAKDTLRAYGTAALTKAHADLEAMLEGNEWLLGQQRTLADAYFIGIARWTKYHDVIDRRNYPRVQGLFDKLEADPAVQFAHAIERGEPAHSSGSFKGEVSLEEALGLLKQVA